MIDLKYRHYLYMSDMMMYVIHHGDNKRCKGNVATTNIRINDMVLGLVDSILQEKVIKENYTTDDIGNSMITGSKLVREIIEFLLFLLVFISTIALGAFIAIGVFVMVFFMYVWDSSKNFWKTLKNT